MYYKILQEECDGERDGARTHDHLIKSQVLYQLSYALALSSTLP